MNRGHVCMFRAMAVYCSFLLLSYSISSDVLGGRDPLPSYFMIALA